MEIGIQLAQHLADIAQGRWDEVGGGVTVAKPSGPLTALFQRMSQSLPPVLPPGWEAIDAQRRRMRFPGRIKEDQWTLLCWVHYSIFMIGPLSNFERWAPDLPSIGLVLTYVDEWVDEAASPALRLARLRWVEDVTCHAAVLATDPDCWPEGLYEDGPILWDVWKSEVQRMGPERWERCRLWLKEMLAHEAALIPCGTDPLSAEDKLAHRWGSVVTTMRALAVAYGAEHWPADVFGHAAAWLILVDDLEDVEQDRENQQWNWFVEHPLDTEDKRNAVRALLQRCRENMCGALPEIMQLWEGPIAFFMKAFERRCK